jgi:colicin import membrane protein
MSTPRSRELLLALAWAVSAQSAGAAPDAAAEQRERNAQARQVVEHDAQVAQAACAQRFAVTDCVNRVKAEKRERLLQLDRERAVLDDELRKRRAAERLAAVAQRQAARVVETPEATLRARKPAVSEAAASANAATRSPDAAIEVRQAVVVQTEAAAAQRAAAAARRAEQAQAHRSAVEARNVERAKQREPAKPLPLPPGSAASQ